MDPARYRQLIGRRLRNAIEALGLTPAGVSREMEVSQQKLNNWMRGDHYPDVWFIYRFCNRYGITTDWLYRGVLLGVPSVLAGPLFSAEEASQGAATAPAPPENETP